MLLLTNLICLASDLVNANTMSDQLQNLSYSPKTHPIQKYIFYKNIISLKQTINIFFTEFALNWFQQFSDNCAQNSPFYQHVQNMNKCADMLSTHRPHPIWDNPERSVRFRCSCSTWRQTGQRAGSDNHEQYVLKMISLSKLQQTTVYITDMNRLKMLFYTEFVQFVQKMI